MPFSIVNADITTLHVDAIVNAANGRLLMGGGVCGAIFSAAGASKLQAACDKVSPCETGSAVATPGFDLPARYVIHAVGPVWRGGGQGEKELLASCYTTSLEIATGLHCSSIAFPLISSGIYGYPREEAYAVARDAIETYLASQNDLDVYLALFPGASLMGSQERRSLDAYIDNNLAQQRLQGARNATKRFRPGKTSAAAAGGRPHDGHGGEASPRPLADGAAPPGWRETQAGLMAGASLTAAEPCLASQGADSLSALLDQVDAPFGETLLAMIDSRNLTDAQVYHRANMTRQHFAKLRAGKNPSKRTVLALCIALGLDTDESALLLGRAGFAFNPSDKGDIIVRYYLERGNATVIEVNLALYEYDQPLLTR